MGTEGIEPTTSRLLLHYAAIYTKKSIRRAALPTELRSQLRLDLESNQGPNGRTILVTAIRSVTI